MKAIHWGESPVKGAETAVEGAIVEIDGMQFFRVRNYDRMRPFLMSVVSSSNHWMFVSSTGGLTCGRAHPDRALFPYCTDDKVHDSASHTGPKTCLLVEKAGKNSLWIPFDDGLSVYETERNLYKSVYGSRLVFEEINRDLGLAFSFEWAVGERFGFIRTSRLVNLGSEGVKVRLLDGLRNLLPPGVSQEMQTRLSTLVDAYKQAEVHAPSGAGIYALSSLPTDLAQPREALCASVACCVGLDEPTVLLSERQLRSFCAGNVVRAESHSRGQRGAYFVQSAIELPPVGNRVWRLVADVGLGPSSLARYLDDLGRTDIDSEIAVDIVRGELRLQQLAASADGLQYSGDRRVSGRHYANTLFNIMRGGTFVDGYNVPVRDFLGFVSRWNRPLRERFGELLADRDVLSRAELLRITDSSGDEDMKRLAREYLPLTFSRRHGDPSRPWNRFHIDVVDEAGKQKLAYEGNWRDIFQNWEALGFSYPEFLESFVCRFLNASTMDGYNPYRISQEGFDWEVLDPHDDWSNIGYWGDHQVVYLLRLLQWSGRFFPGQIARCLGQRMFVYADVPYRIKPYRQLLLDPRDSIGYDMERDAELAARAEEIGSDGKLLTRADGATVRASLLEKLLVTVLCKLGNFVPGGGIWMNTQRPEWNDANNALAGYGLSMVTVAYLRRFLAFLAELVAEADEASWDLAEEVTDYLLGVSRVLDETRPEDDTPVSPQDRKVFMDRVGRLGSDYRERVYRRPSGKQKVVSTQQVLGLVESALAHLDHTIGSNRRPDGLYHSYNLVGFGEAAYTVEPLAEMLEGQVAVLGSGLLEAKEGLALLDALKRSALYRADQQSYLLYPDRGTTSFLDRNVVPEQLARDSRVIRRELSANRTLLVEQDLHGKVHFNSAIAGSEDLRAAIDRAGNLDADDARELLDIYEAVFRHREFTGRSSSMYKYEGLGCIYWHMVSKLLLGVGELMADARLAGADESLLEALANHAEDIRNGLGLKKSPGEYGAIPLDPYSHTPGFAGVQQPGMTGQVKEDILSRLVELGVSVEEGRLAFRPHLIRDQEFAGSEGSWRLPAAPESRPERIEKGSLAFLLFGVPVIYRPSDESRITLHGADGTRETIEGTRLDRRRSRSLFGREGLVRKIVVDILRDA